jgi:hypothetical protein
VHCKSYLLPSRPSVLRKEEGQTFSKWRTMTAVAGPVPRHTTPRSRQGTFLARHFKVITISQAPISLAIDLSEASSFSKPT